MGRRSPTFVRAARSLGAGPFYAFWKVYFPQPRAAIPGGVCGHADADAKRAQKQVAEDRVFWRRGDDLAIGAILVIN
ncbi:hypothetical protein XH84_10580 [Bradyrhizobium nanningense]|nr:hypothetical protein XH84_10580 [Bradyrhizobium nanningense]